MLTRKTLTFLVPITAAAALASLGGCELIASVDRTKINPGTGGAGATGGAGGTTTTGGGGTMCSEATCTDDIEQDCLTSECENGTCNSMVNEAVGTPCENADNVDAKFCNPDGECVFECVEDLDCPNGEVCNTAAGTCLSPQCQNKTQDPGETDEDCGGPVCGKTCENDEGCTDGSVDCISGFCDMTNGGPGGGPATGVCAACTGSSDCAANEYCDTDDNGGTCKGDQPLGADCTSFGGDSCVSGNCADGVCCDDACGTQCDACTMALTGVADGTCANISNGNDDPDQACPGGTTCDGAGACALFADGTVCTLVTGAECSSGNCVDGFCCDGTCGATCESCGLAGDEGQCTNIPNAADPDNECPGATTCNGSQACALFGNGTACPGGDAECSSGNCVDGVCCSTASCGTCQACNISGMAGSCNDVAQLATDPGTCDGATEACDGNGACKLGNGETCTGNGECASDDCGGLGGGGGGGSPTGTCQ